MVHEETLKEHDREIGKLFVVTERLAEGQDKMNDKMDKLVDNTNKYDVLMAQLVETTKHFQESMGRAYKRIESIENRQNTTGCPVVQKYFEERKYILKNYDRQIDDFKETFKEINAWRTWLNRFLAGQGLTLIFALIGIIWSTK